MGCGKLEKSLALIAAEPHPPTPWRDGTQIPWHDSDFSERMLKVHLDQSTHMASRSREVIVSHVRWLTRLLESTLGRDRGLRILDIGCGPGLYCHELARRGHSAVGFDFAPAPLRWARETADSERLECEFHHLDLTRLETADIESLGVFDAVTFWFGEFHSFPTATARRFLPQLAALLRPGGVFALEFQTFDSYPPPRRTGMDSLRVFRPVRQTPSLASGIPLGRRAGRRDQRALGDRFRQRRRRALRPEQPGLSNLRSGRSLRRGRPGIAGLPPPRSPASAKDSNSR